MRRMKRTRVLKIPIPEGYAPDSYEIIGGKNRLYLKIRCMDRNFVLLDKRYLRAFNSPYK